MNQVAKIEGLTGQAYRLPFAHRSDPFTFTPPAADTEWHPLPDILDGITFATRFTGSSKGYGEDRAHLDHVHVARGKVFAADTKCLVEYDVGECPDFSILPVRVAQIKAFGEAPSHVSLDQRLKLKWSNGNTLITRFRTFSRKIDAFEKLLAAHEWDDFVTMDPDWRDQIIGQFSYKPARENEGLIHFTPDRIVGGPEDKRPTTQLPTVTHAQADVTFHQMQLLRALKVADALKFVHGDGVSHFLFKAENVRGIMVLDRPLDPVPVLS